MTAIARLRPHWLRLRTRFTVFVLAGVGLISLAMALLTYHGSSQALLAARQEHLMAFARSQAWELARSLGQVSGAARNLSTFLEVWHPANSEEAMALLRHHLQEAPKVYGMALAYAPFAFDSRQRFYAPYIYRSSQGFKELNLDSPTYDYLAQDWFLIPNQLQNPNWAEPYFDEGGGEVLMTTYSAPMVKNGQVLGVATADVDLERLGREVAGLAVGQRGYAFLITKQGTFLAAPEESWVMRETFFSLAEALQRPDMRALGQRMVRGSSGLVKVTDWRSGRPAWLAFVPVPGPGWSLGVMAPEDEVLAPVVSLAHQQTLWAMGGLAALVLVVWWMMVRLTEPLHHLVAAARRLAGGDLSTHVEDVRPGDEVGDLAQSFNLMVDDLKRYVQELTFTTKAKERIESELDLARQIQQSVLPRTYPPFPDRSEFDLFAQSLPAREVGGDFYDFFFIDPDHLGLVMADVSGKGVPAALFMTVARTLIKTAAQHHPEPLKAINEVNAQIIPDNEMCMFVTVFYGVYGIKTGQLRYVSAGHPSPLLRRAGGQVEQLPRAQGLALGIMDDLRLEMGRINLEVGDTLLVFTDGLDEAINQDNQMFGLGRVGQWLAQALPNDAPQMLDDLIANWRGFTGPVEQFDDLTLLLFRRRQ
ncbi:MAG: SpoIIE family protein phosphatase [Desulfarculus sp.]|nr:SpoIIE family protein phosphatase [Desulfarculus sp.]